MVGLNEFSRGGPPLRITILNKLHGISATVVSRDRVVAPAGRLKADGILNHCCDETNAHVRGCWVVDLVLGKE